MLLKKSSRELNCPNKQLNLDNSKPSTHYNKAKYRDNKLPLKVNRSLMLKYNKTPLKALRFCNQTGNKSLP